MKRVIAILTPMPEQSIAASSVPGGQTPPFNESVHGLAELELHETRIEVVVSDQQAERILLAVLGSEPVREESEAAEFSLEQAVLNELRETETSSPNLLDQILSKVERKVIEAVYSKCDRNKSRAAMHLGINRNTLLKKLRQFGAVTDEEHAEELLESS
jgi:DNA-binding protein Fis